MVITQFLQLKLYVYINVNILIRKNMFIIIFIILLLTVDNLHLNQVLTLFYVYGLNRGRKICHLYIYLNTFKKERKKEKKS